MTQLSSPTASPPSSAPYPGCDVCGSPLPPAPAAVVFTPDGDGLCPRCAGPLFPSPLRWLCFWLRAFLDLRRPGRPEGPA